MIPIDERADTFPVGLQDTPFEEVYKALRTVAASVWAVDPVVYRAGMAWGWYALNAPDKLAGFRAVVVAALISAFAPMIKDNQTDAGLVEYLRLWRAYKPTFGALGELFSVFGASVEVRAISDEESQSVVPVSDTRLAFYLRITGIDFSRPLSLSEAVEIARRATPLGSRPFAYYAIPSRITVPCGPAPEPAFVLVENNTVAELPPVVVLPEVSIDSNPVGSGTQTLVVNDFTGPLHYTGSGGWSGDAIPYDTNKKYSLTTYNNGTLGGLQACGIFVPTSVSTQSGGPYYVGVKNISSTSQSFMSVYVATCSSNQATVVPVYDSSNVAYNAFKYTKNGTDYYYVLDGTQTDWTDDLSSIGYHAAQPEPEYLDILFYYNAYGNSVTFAANDYWSTRIRNDSDKAALENFGVPIGTSDTGRQYVARTAVDSFTFTPIALYSGDGGGDLQADMSNFYCAIRGGNPDPTSLYYGVCICSINAYGTNTQTWKCRVTRSS